MVESEEEVKSLLMKVEEDSEKAGFKLNIQKTKIMTSSPITSWQIDGETVETVADFIFLGSKITADFHDCSHEIKRCLLFGRKAKTNLDSKLKIRDINLPTKVYLVKAIYIYDLFYWRNCKHNVVNQLYLNKIKTESNCWCKLRRAQPHTLFPKVSMSRDTLSGALDSLSVLPLVSALLSISSFLAAGPAHQ